jgi:membrane associated rhomboid family serine protease
MEYEVGRRDEEYLLLVAPDHAAQARAELAAYWEENRDWPPPEEGPPPLAGGAAAALGFSGVLVAVAVLESTRAGGWDWRAAGVGDSELIRQGAWWRAVTALTLHAGADHLAGNLLFGSLFAALLSRAWGTGPACLGMLVGGAAGNLVNALLRSSPHGFVGASTAVFAAVGSLAAWHGLARRSARGRWRPWLPWMAAAALLSLLGTEGERTDVPAHVAGLLCGTGIGLAVGWLGPPACLPAGVRTGLAWAALLLVAWSWVRAVGLG